MKPAFSRVKKEGEGTRATMRPLFWAKTGVESKCGTGKMNPDWERRKRKLLISSKKILRILNERIH